MSGQRHPPGIDDPNLPASVLAAEVMTERFTIAPWSTSLRWAIEEGMRRKLLVRAAQDPRPGRHRLWNLLAAPRGRRARQPVTHTPGAGYY
jgi:hypothetical protein